MRRRDVRAPEEPRGAADCQRGMRVCVDFRDVRPAAVTPRTAPQAARRGAPLARVLASAAITVACVALPARAQAPSPFVPDDHWVHHALRRLDALGLLRAGYDPGTRSVPERQAGRLLLDALGAAAGTPYEGLARAYLQRFVEEFGDGWGEPAREASPFRLAGAAGVGFAAERGGMGAGSGYRNGSDWTGPTPIPASDDVLSAFELRAYAGRYAAGRVAARAWRDSAGLGDAYVLLAAGKVGAWFGRRAAGFGPVAGRGVVLSGAHAFMSGGLALLEGVTLPGPLRHLGPVRVETFLSSVHENGAVAEPWFWAGRLSIQPHRRLVLGVNRAAMFGGDGNPPLSLRDLLYVMIGKHAGEGSEVDNQIAAVDVWYRVPVGFAPIAVYAEWGFEDSAGAWKDVPGIVARGERDEQCPERQDAVAEEDAEMRPASPLAGDPALQEDVDHEVLERRRRPAGRVPDQRLNVERPQETDEAEQEGESERDEDDVHQERRDCWEQDEGLPARHRRLLDDRNLLGGRFCGVERRSGLMVAPTVARAARSAAGTRTGSASRTTVP